MHYCENKRFVTYLRPKNYCNGQNCRIRLKESKLSLYLMKIDLLTLSLRKRYIEWNITIDQNPTSIYIIREQYIHYVQSWTFKITFYA